MSKARYSKAQVDAIQADGSRVLVIAGPGTGKSTTMAGRVHYLVRELKVTPSRIAVITFTKLAATEIREKIGRIGEAFIGTLHAFALRIVMEWGATLGYEQDWITILDDVEAELDEKEILAEHGLIKKKVGGKFEWRKIRAKDWADFKDQVVNGTFDPDAHHGIKVNLMYTAWMALINRYRSQNVLTFSTMMYEAHNVLRDPKALEFYQTKYEHVLIDEVQDTSHIQWRVVWKLIEGIKPACLWCVGDLDQSLYSWRGAEPEELIRMSEGRDTTVYPLMDTYRYGKKIRDASYSLIQHNKIRIDMKVNPHPAAKDWVYRVDGANSDVLANLILKAKENGYRGNEIAVLARTHAILEETEEACKRAGVGAYRVGKNGGLMKSSQFRACMGYLRMSVNKMDVRAFMAVTATEGLSEDSIREIRQKALRDRCTLKEAYEPSKHWPDNIHDLEKYLQDTDPLSDYSQAVDYLLVLSAFEGLTTAELVRDVLMRTAQDEIREANEDQVVLCTCHAAKGLEWPCVFVAGLTEKIMPSNQSVVSGRVEEERRLLYVAMTRAKESLFLVHSLPDDPYAPTGPSMFSKEIEVTNDG